MTENNNPLRAACAQTYSATANAGPSSMATDATQRRIIRLPEVCRLIGLSRSVVYARIKQKQFPAPIKLGYSSGWIESEVQAWIDGRIDATRNAASPV
ncbi:helix-turn-helix transcriptional regulator [Paraburkholderia bryophila]|uniref:Prophage regulatory protein n=1 Tax=Paraburkholderia bryophila TaxID=420952 RepID=A0A7Z0AY91_9BURK|nr:AlpA family transcriptional regulator [Paraburkholderia bryophila]NYH13458.1 prophage regulatory protein [Paraburkholderia bryophila]